MSRKQKTEVDQSVTKQKDKTQRQTPKNTRESHKNNELPTNHAKNKLEKPTKTSKRNKKLLTKQSQQFYNSEVFKWLFLMALIIIAVNIHLEGALTATKQNNKYKQQQSSNKQVEHTINLLDTIINMMSSNKNSKNVKPRGGGDGIGKKNDLFDQRIQQYKKPAKPEFKKKFGNNNLMKNKIEGGNSESPYLKKSNDGSNSMKKDEAEAPKRSILEEIELIQDVKTNLEMSASETVPLRIPVGQLPQIGASQTVQNSQLPQYLQNSISPQYQRLQNSQAQASPQTGQISLQNSQIQTHDAQNSIISPQNIQNPQQNMQIHQSIISNPQYRPSDFLAPPSDIRTREEVERDENIAKFEAVSGDIKYAPFKRPCGVKQESNLFVVIMSASKDDVQRQQIRMTWMKQMKMQIPNSTYLFVLSSSQDEIIEQSILSEANDKGDMLISSHVDKYQVAPFPIQLYLTVIKFIAQQCARVKQVLFIHSNIDINVSALSTFLNPNPELFPINRQYSEDLVHCHEVIDSEFGAFCPTLCFSLTGGMTTVMYYEIREHFITDTSKLAAMQNSSLEFLTGFIRHKLEINRPTEFSKFTEQPICVHHRFEGGFG